MNGGGVYIYRTRKPASVFGLARVPFVGFVGAAIIACSVIGMGGGPWFLGLAVFLFTGRHFAYVGETVSFKDRHGEHVNGGGRWGRKAQPWSDLDPVCVMRLRLPKWKWLLRSVETFFIFLTWPVYNDRKNKWNPRRIPLTFARWQRRNRDHRGGRLSFNLTAIHLLEAVAIVILWRIA